MMELRWTRLRRGSRTVLAPAESRVPAGAVVGVVGANGAGKSTLLMALAGVLAERCGRARASVDGGEVAAIGYVPQNPGLAPWLRVSEALALQGVDARAVIGAEPALSALEPLLSRHARALSRGQGQTLAVAGILARSDPLVLLDEPFAGVDMRHRAALAALVARHRARNPESVILLASHLAADLDRLCDWLLVLRDGAVAFAGPRDALPRSREEDQGRAAGRAAAELTAGGATELERRLSSLLA